MKITTQLLTKDNETTIAKTLSSVQDLGNIVIGDLGSSDRTIEIAENMGAKVFKTIETNRSKIRNRLILESTDDWQFYIEPWEILTDKESLKGAAQGDCQHVLVMQGDTFTKELRLWKKSSGFKFVNPVYEHLNAEHGPVSNVIIYSKNSSPIFLEDLMRWKETDPAAAAPLYYQACINLSSGNYEQFIILANHYLFLEQKTIRPVLMTKYYLSIIECHQKKRANIALQHALECLAVKPLMAEFWCALADVYYFRIKDYNKAQQFYENAIELGSHRRQDDLWPIDISKYKKYPEQMILSCKKIRKETKIILPIP